MINLGHKIKETWVKLPEEYFTPLTFGELPIGQKFIVLPEPGDNQDQGGFRQANYLFIKTDEDNNDSFEEPRNAVNLNTGAIGNFPDNLYVIAIYE